MKPNLIDAPMSTQLIRRTYDVWSYFYGQVASVYKRGPRMRALDLADIRDGERVLEVAPGPGTVFRSILERLNPTQPAWGVDLSRKMLERTRKNATRSGRHNFLLVEADTRNLPFADEVFDILYNSFMLDLIPFSDIPGILGEYHRVLKPGGRLVLLNLSKEDPERRTLLERFYSLLPPWAAAVLLGGCRPLISVHFLNHAGFQILQREIHRGPLVTEIVMAMKS